MQITAEYLNTQIKNLRTQHEQHLANANACVGAIQVYEQLKDYLEIKDETVHSDPILP